MTEKTPPTVLTQRLKTEAERDLLANIVTFSDDAILTKDMEGTITSWNSGAERFYGYSEDEAIGQHIAILAPLARKEEWRHFMDVILEGGRIKDVETLHVRKDGATIPILITVSPLRDSYDEIIGFSAITGDVTSLKATESAHLQLAEEKTARLVAEKLDERTEFIVDTTAILYSSLDLEEILSSLADFLVPRLTDWCAIDLLDERGEAKLIALTPRYRTIINQEKSQDRIDLADEHAQILRIEGVSPLPLPENIDASSLMIAPIVGHEGTLGSVTLANRGERPFTEDGLHLVEDLAKRAGAAIDNTRLYNEHSQIAHTLQQTLLLPKLPHIDGLEIAALNRPVGRANEIGGDFYELYELDHGSWAAVLGDAMGKGAEAATMTFAARHSLRTASLYEPSPGKALALVNESIFRYETPVVFCTMSYARLDIEQDKVGITIANGGQPLPLLINDAGEVQHLGRTGIALGAFRSVEISDHSQDLLPGDRVVFYTDGVTEASGARSTFREKELIALLATCAKDSPQEIIDKIEAAVLASTDRLHDDIAILVLGRPLA